MPETEPATKQAPLATPPSTATATATAPPAPPDTGPRAPTTGTPQPSASSDPIAAYRAKLARPGYAYLRRFAEPVLAQLASATGGERDRLAGRLDAMFAVSHSPDGFGLTEVKQASNRYHDELGRAAIAKFRVLKPGATAIASHQTAEPVARQVERETDPLLEDDVHLRVKLASVQDAEVEGQVDAQISIAPNFWEWVGLAIAVLALGGAMYADAHDEPAPEPVYLPAPRGRTALDRKGRARGAANPQAVRAAAEAAVPAAAVAALGANAVVATTPVVGGSEFSITPDGRPAFRIRINSCPLGERVYRVVLNASKVSVLQISEAAADASIARAVAAGIAEIAELVRALGANEVPGESDMLVAGGNVADGATLTARDLAAVAQLALLVVRLEATHGREERRPVYADLHRLIDDLALRAGVAGSDRRRAAIDPHLSPAARRWVVDLGAAAAALGPTYARPFVEAEAEAEVDRQRDASRAQLEAPLHETPRRRARVSREAAGRLAAAARMRRRAKSERMVEKYTNLAQTAGAALHSVTDPQIGGGAALSAVRPNQLLVDDRGRWQVDESEDIAQTAAQLRWVSDAGLGDPFEFVANPNDRVPMTAVRYWEDTLATQADVINGRARVSVEAALGLVMTITPTEGANIRLRVNGAPMVASGFPPETSPRPRAPEPATAKTDLQAVLGGMGGPAVATLALLGAVDPKTDASMAQFVNTADPVILGQLRAGAAPAPAAMAVFDAAASWQLRHVPLPGGQRVLTGDEANTAQLDPASAAHWVIAGVGGTGISAAEIILDKNRVARVTMYGGTATAGLFDNVQARRVMRLHGPMGDRRFQVITSQDVGALTTNDGGATYDVGAVTGNLHLTAVPGALGPWQAARRILAATDPLLLPTIRTLLQTDRAAEQHHITTRQPGTYARMLITFVGADVPQALRDAPDFAALLDEFGPVCGTIRLQVATGFGAVGAAGRGSRPDGSASTATSPRSVAAARARRRSSRCSPTPAATGTRSRRAFCGTTTAATSAIASRSRRAPTRRSTSTA